MIIIIESLAFLLDILLMSIVEKYDSQSQGQIEEIDHYDGTMKILPI